MEKKGRSDINPKKKQVVEELAVMLKEYPVVGLIDLHKMPAFALQNIKMNLKDKMKIRVAKKRMINFALEKAGRENLKEYVVGYPALIFSKEDPFKLYSLISKQVEKRSAKPGDVPEEDVVVKAGPTQIPPGPAISTLSKVKILGKVQGPTIAIIKDCTPCKAGEPVSIDLSSALQMLKITPMKVSLNVLAFAEDKAIYTKDQMFVDEVKLVSDIQLAVQNAFNLSMNSGFPTKVTIGFMLSKAQMEAKALEALVDSGAPKEEEKSKEQAPKEKSEGETENEQEPAEKKEEEQS
ncbi:MAG: 50S ribosomal protein L10 [Candidatus Aenigmarchaeota archaeon]|nr:50S ribosomal protein L10 [Candidatus Aenigmarchaeota archaeon]